MAILAKIGLFVLTVSLVALPAALSAAATHETLIDAARRDGEVVFYASMNLGEANALITEFEKRYPPIKVRLQRTGSEKLLTRVLTESRAGKFFADVIQTVEFSMYTLRRHNVLARYIPESNSTYPREFKDEGFWTTVYYNAYVTGYNSKLVPPRDLPKSYEDLLDAKWKGKLMMEGTKADWLAGMLQILGQERGVKYMRELAKQQPSPREGHELLAQLVAAGEGLFDVNIPASSVERLKERGAPIEWTALGAVPAIMVGSGLSAHAPHPNAAKLFLEFVLSRDGQKLMQTPGRHVARRDVAGDQSPRLRELRIVPVNPALAEKLDEYAKQLRSMFGS